MARMPSARTMPNTVAQFRITEVDGMLFLVSMDMSLAAAVTRALVICAAVKLCGAWINQPLTETLPCRPSVWTACWVITVLGADVPDGSAPASSITGLARQLPAGQGNEVWLGPPLGPPDRLDRRRSSRRRAASW